MVYVAYDIPETGLLALFSVSLIFLRVIYIADKFLFPRLLPFLLRDLASYL
jgi:hypothetical protein